MSAQAVFFRGALLISTVTAVIFTAGWLWCDRAATIGDNLLRQGELDPYDYEHGSVNHGAVPENRASSHDYLFLLKIVPATILGVWFVGSLIIWGPGAFRWKKLKSHLSALK